MQKEIFKDIPGYEGLYKISNLGNVKTFHYNINRLLSLCNSKYGYKTVTLSKNKKTTTITVHLLMAITFLNHTSGRKVVVDHKDNDKTNNRLNNIQIITQRKNCSKDKHRYNSSSKYIGVSRGKRRNKWRSHIQINGKLKYLGSFKDEYKAHLAYQKALKTLTQKEI